MATAIACGLKRVETRSWPTNYRGSIAIHAAKHWTDDEEIWWGLNIEKNPTFLGAFDKIGIHHPGELPFGAIVATAILEHCTESEKFIDGVWMLTEQEELFGNFSAGRFGWILRDVVPITPVPFRGRQGFFDWTP